MLWSLNPISGEWSEANLIFKVKQRSKIKKTKVKNQPKIKGFLLILSRCTTSSRPLLMYSSSLPTLLWTGESNTNQTKPKQATFREAENDGWCQYQAVIQTFLGPLFAVFASATALDTIAGSVQVHLLSLPLRFESFKDKNLIFSRCGN